MFYSQMTTYQHVVGSTKAENGMCSVGTLPVREDGSNGVVVPKDL